MHCPDYQRLLQELDNERQLRAFETARAERAEVEMTRLRNELSFFGKRIAALIAPTQLRALHTTISLGKPYQAVCKDVAERASRIEQMEEGRRPAPEPEDTETLMNMMRDRMQKEIA